MLSPKNVIYFIVKATKFTAHAQCHVTCVWIPPKPQVTIFWPQIVYSLYTFYGATMLIKGTFIREHPHVKVVFGRKKCPVKIGPQNGSFLEI